MPITNTLAAASARGFGFGTEDAFGEQVFTSPGTYTFYVPAGVTSVSMVSVGAGGGGSRGARYTSASDPNSITAYSPIPGSLTTAFYSGGGGGLAYKNSVSVTPGQPLTVFVGRAGTGALSGDDPGQDSYVANAGGTKLVQAGGGSSGSSGAGGAVIVGDGGGTGGAGGNWRYSGSSTPTEKVFTSGGGGGAGGYTGNGGAGGDLSNGANGSGGGAGGGGGGAYGSYTTGGRTYSFGSAGAAGGGVGLFGKGSDGTGGIKTPTPFTDLNPSAGGGTGGSGGTTGKVSDGTSGGGNNTDGTFGVYGGGGGGAGSRITDSSGSYTCLVGFAGDGQNGAVRIVWSTNTSVPRTFPSTNVGQL